MAMNSRVLRMADTPFLAGAEKANAVFGPCSGLLPPTTRITMVDVCSLSAERATVIHQVVIYPDHLDI